MPRTRPSPFQVIQAKAGISRNKMTGGHTPGPNHPSFPRKRKSSFFLLVLACLLPHFAPAATSNIFTSPRDSVSLISQTNNPGTVTLALTFHLNPGWHIYWSNPGDAGVPPQITLAPPAAAGPLSFPPPELLSQPPVTDYVLSGNFLLPFTATNTGPAIAADTHWLVCADICVPEHAHFSLALTGGPANEASQFTPPQVIPSPFPATITPQGLLTLTGPTAAQVKSAYFFPTAPGQIQNSADQPLSFTNVGLSLQLTPARNFDAKTFTGLLELTDKSGAMQALALSPTLSTASATPLLTWLALAFLGGLILNLMPCVFPILALKALAIIRASGQHHAQIRRESFAYTAGILTAFTLIGGTLILLRALGSKIGWGFQLQSPIFIAAMALLILAIALNLAGIFKVNALQNIGNSLAARGSFFTGLLAVAVATPCTAPFMGGAIAAALAAPLPAAFGIFLALGIGLSAPFLVIALIPATARLLPRPGAWMILVQRLLSIPMFATFLWLTWVFTTQLNPAATPLTLPDAQPFSQSLLAQDRAAKTPVFIDMTAAWCITCLVNEHSSLENPAVQSAFAAAHIKTLVGDWTNRNPEISAFLEANHRDGVPLYLYYAPDAATPVTLPQILTPQIILNAIH
jgi:thiol:disulfide interchange protein DsbD